MEASNRKVEESSATNTNWKWWLDVINGVGRNRNPMECLVILDETSKLKGLKWEQRMRTTFKNSCTPHKCGFQNQLLQWDFSTGIALRELRSILGCFSSLISHFSRAAIVSQKVESKGNLMFYIANQSSLQHHMPHHLASYHSRKKVPIDPSISNAIMH